jgi:hypothetical protein
MGGLNREVEGYRAQAQAAGQALAHAVDRLNARWAALGRESVWSWGWQEGRRAEEMGGKAQLRARLPSSNEADERWGSASLA